MKFKTIFKTWKLTALSDNGQSLQADPSKLTFVRTANTTEETWNIKIGLHVNWNRNINKQMNSDTLWLFPVVLELAARAPSAQLLYRGICFHHLRRLHLHSLIEKKELSVLNPKTNKTASQVNPKLNAYNRPNYKHTCLSKLVLLLENTLSDRAPIIWHRLPI